MTHQLNGSAKDMDVQPHREVTEHTPIAYYQPIAITPALIKWFAITIMAALSYGVGTGLLFMPAKDTELQTLRQVVEAMRKEQQEQHGMFKELSTAIGGIKIAVDDVQRKIGRASAPLRKVN